VRGGLEKTEVQRRVEEKTAKKFFQSGGGKVKGRKPGKLRALGAGRVTSVRDGWGGCVKVGCGVQQRAPHLLGERGKVAAQRGWQLKKDQKKGKHRFPWGGWGRPDCFVSVGFRGRGGGFWG